MSARIAPVPIRQRIVSLVIGGAVLGSAIAYSEIDAANRAARFSADTSTEVAASGDADLFAGLRVQLECWRAPMFGNRFYGCRVIR